MSNIQLLTREEIQKSAPAVYAKAPKSSMTDRYTFVSTEKIIDDFAEAGWYPTKAFQSKPSKRTLHRNPAERKHVVRLSNPSFAPVMREAGELTPEILLINSHDGSSSLKLMIGLFRLICSNGLIISSSIMTEITKRHSGEKDEIFRILHETTKQFPDIWDRVNEYSTLNLSNNQKIDFATKVIEFNWGKTSAISPEALLIPRRNEDKRDDIFHVMNVVQENIIKGGVNYMHPYKNTLRHTKSIKNASKDIRINVFLWQIMENYRVSGKFIL
jgi:hypothetical protein